MQYIKNIGIKAKKAFENLNKVKHNDIKKVLQTFNKLIILHTKFDNISSLGQ